MGPAVGVAAAIGELIKALGGLGPFMLTLLLLGALAVTPFALVYMLSVKGLASLRSEFSALANAINDQTKVIQAGHGRMEAGDREVAVALATMSARMEALHERAGATLRKLDHVEAVQTNQGNLLSIVAARREGGGGN